MKPPRILVAESAGFPQEAFNKLSEAGTVILADLGESELRRAVPDVDVLWVRLRNRIDSGLIDAAPRLKILVSPTTGVNHIDVKALERRQIRLVSLRGEVEFLKNVRATAEFTLALTLALVRRLPEAAKDAAAGHWRRDRFQGSELYGKTVGIVGYGRLGQLVARYLEAFDVNLLLCDPVLPLGSISPRGESVSLAQLTAQSDIVTLHADLREENARFFGAVEFGAMKTGSYFINTARGELVDEKALLHALVSGQLAGAALDVLSGENSAGMSHNPVVRYAALHNNLILTPHLGGCTTESKTKTETFLAEKLHGLLMAQMSEALLETR